MLSLPDTAEVCAVASPAGAPAHRRDRDNLAVMDAEEMRARAASFGAVADKYADHRPGYPDEAVRWLVGTSPGRVLELGAGTGKLSAGIAELGHDVVAVDPSAEMLEHLRRHTPAAHPVVARAEHIPLATSSVDVVVAAQAFHWFDQGQALPEIARVLRPGGVLSLVWNNGDLTVPWVKKVFALMDLTTAGAGDDPLEGSDLFTSSEAAVFRHWKQFHRRSLVGFVASQSRAGLMTPDERDDLLAKVGELYDGYGRGPDGMLMPWKSYAYRARVSVLGNVRREVAEDPGPSDGLDGGLLIDFP